MKRFRLSVWLLALCACWLPVSPLLSADKAGDVVTTPALVTRATLEARLKEVEASTRLDEDARASLVETINKALGNLEAIKTSKATTEAYVQARKTAPEQASATMRVNDVVVGQDSVWPTADSAAELLAVLSGRFGFRPGDTVALGPVGSTARSQGVTLMAGDTFSVGLDGIMSLSVEIAA